MPDERIGRRRFLRRGAGLGVSISALVRFLSRRTITGMVEKSGGVAITIPIEPLPLLPVFETIAGAYTRKTSNVVNLSVFPRDHQLFSKQLLTADARSYDRQTP